MKQKYCKKNSKGPQDFCSFWNPKMVSYILIYKKLAGTLNFKYGDANSKGLLDLRSFEDNGQASQWYTVNNFLLKNQP